MDIKQPYDAGSVDDRPVQSPKLEYAKLIEARTLGIIYLDSSSPARDVPTIIYARRSQI